MSIASLGQSKLLRLLTVLLSSLLLLPGCTDGGPMESPVADLPDYPVSYRIDLRSSEGVRIASPLSAIVITRPRDDRDRLGVGGLVICHGLPGELSEETYMAYDAHCPLCYPTPAKVVPDKVPQGESLLTATCQHCGAVYDLSLGIGQVIISEGARRAVLKRYPTSLSGTLLTIGY